MALETELSAADQAQFDAMRAADSAPIASGEEAAAPAPALPATDLTDAPASTAAEPDKKDVVPLKTFLEERRKLEDRIAEERKARQTLEERTNIILQRQFAQPAATEPKPPDIPEFDKDPVAHIVGTMERQGSTQAQIMAALQNLDNQARQHQAISAVRERTSASEQEFATENPDYHSAVSHLQSARHQELAEMGYTDPAQRQAIITQDAIGVAARALEMGKNPAQVFYALAKQRGFTGAKPATTETPAAEAAAGSTAEGRVRAAAAGQEHARSLGSVRGAAPPPLTAQRLLEMSEADFNKMVETPEGKALLGS